MATVSPDGQPHVVLVAFRYNPDQDTIDIGGHGFARRKKYRDVQRNPRAAFVVDDLASISPWRPRMVEIRGQADVLAEGARSSSQASTQRCSASGRVLARVRAEEVDMAKEMLCAYGIDVDAVGGWLGSYAGEDSPNDISRGLFAGEIGAPRLLRLFDKYGLKTTWFIPGHSIETFPEPMKLVVDAGHEVGVHGYSHENPIAMRPEQEEEVLTYCIGLVGRLSGRRPRGYVAPWWEVGSNTVALLQKYGLAYDHGRAARPAGVAAIPRSGPDPATGPG